MQAVTRDPAYAVVARDPRPCLVLEVPVGVRTGTDRIGPGEALTFHQFVHEKRLLSGGISRMPLDALAYYRASPAIMFLAGETPPPGDVAADLERRMAELDVGWVVVHPAMLDKERLAVIMRMLEKAPRLERIELPSPSVFFRRNAPALAAPDAGNR